MKSSEKRSQKGFDGIIWKYKGVVFQGGFIY